MFSLFFCKIECANFKFSRFSRRVCPPKLEKRSKKRINRGFIAPPPTRAQYYIYQCIADTCPTSSGHFSRIGRLSPGRRTAAPAPSTPCSGGFRPISSFPLLSSTSRPPCLLSSNLLPCFYLFPPF